MGLDMCLEKRKTNSNEEPIELVYWRKVNAVHKFFTKDYKRDNTTVIPVTKEKLEDLVNRCTEVLIKRTEECSKELLPTTLGFFFGSISYDEEYYKGIEETKENIIRVLENEYPLAENEVIEYFAWY